MTHQEGNDEKGPAPWLFFFGVVGWTWLWLLPAVVSGRDWLEFPMVLLSGIGLLGPLVVPAILIGRGWWDSSLDPTVGHFFRRCVAIRSLDVWWLFALVGLVVLLAFGPLLLEPATVSEQGLLEVAAPAFVVVGLLGALEEPGWRGYGQEALQRRMPVVAAGVVIGVFWAIWHLPLFFIGGTYHSQLGVGTGDFWAFQWAIIVGAPFYGWLYNAAGKAVVAVMLYHGVGNVARELAPDVSSGSALAVEAAMTLVVVILSWRWMSRAGPES